MIASLSLSLTANVVLLAMWLNARTRARRCEQRLLAGGLGSAMMTILRESEENDHTAGA